MSNVKTFVSSVLGRVISIELGLTHGPARRVLTATIDAVQRALYRLDAAIGVVRGQ